MDMLRQIIEACSRSGDLVADLFIGPGSIANQCYRWNAE